MDPKAQDKQSSDNTSDNAPTAPDLDQIVVARVGIKVPEFWRAEPELWFLRLEAQFRQAKILSDQCRFDHTVASLSSEVLMEVSDILRSPTTGRAYQDLKERLLDRYSVSADERINRLMEMTLGDLKPTQLLHRMQALAINSISKEVLRNLWLDRLPPQVRGVVSIIDGDLEELAKKADKYMRCTNLPIMSVEEKPSIEKAVIDLSNQLGALSRKVDSNEKHLPIQPARTTNHTPSDDLCYYHRRFGSNAKKCRSPCNFPKNDQGAQ